VALYTTITRWSLLRSWVLILNELRNKNMVPPSGGVESRERSYRLLSNSGSRSAEVGRDGLQDAGQNVMAGLQSVSQSVKWLAGAIVLAPLATVAVHALVHGSKVARRSGSDSEEVLDGGP
jgi:hypothetical protein